MQKLFCPVCGKLLIKNVDLVTDKPVSFEIDEVKNAPKDKVGVIMCYNCKRRIKYIVKDN